MTTMAARASGRTLRPDVGRKRWWTPCRAARLGWHARHECIRRCGAGRRRCSVRYCADGRLGLAKGRCFTVLALGRQTRALIWSGALPAFRSDGASGAATGLAAAALLAHLLNKVRDPPSDISSRSSTCPGPVAGKAALCTVAAVALVRSLAARLDPVTPRQGCDGRNEVIGAWHLMQGR